MTRFVLLLAASLLAAGLTTPTAAATNHCDHFEALCNAIAAVMRACDMIADCEVSVGPLPDLSWIEESVQHLCDHWIQQCEIETAGAPVLP